MQQQGGIWLLLDSRDVGGIETHVHNLALALLMSGKNCKVVLLKNYGEHPLFDRCDIPPSNLLKIRRGLFELLKKVKEYKPLVIHTHGYKSGIVARLLLSRLNIPVVSTFHAGECENFKLQFYKYIDRKSAFLSNNIAVNKKISREVSQSCQVINNFILNNREEELIPVKLTQSINFAFVGRLSKEKGPERFVDFAAYNPQHNFFIFGDGPMKKKLALTAPDNVSFQGRVSTMNGHWKSIDVLMITSYTEGLPLVALEAMSRGITVVSSAVGGIPDLITHNQNGFLISTQSEKNYIQQLQKVVNKWLGLKTEKRLSIMESARQTIKEGYSAEAVLPKLLSIYHRATKQRLSA